MVLFGRKLLYYYNMLKKCLLHFLANFSKIFYKKVVCLKVKRRICQGLFNQFCATSEYSNLWIQSSFMINWLLMNDKWCRYGWKIHSQHFSIFFPYLSVMSCVHLDVDTLLAMVLCMDLFRERCISYLIKINDT